MNQDQETFGVALCMGPLARSIAEQLNDSGLRLKPNVDGVSLQKDADALTRCVVNNLIPNTVVQKARQKLVNRITKLIEPKRPSADVDVKGGQDAFDAWRQS